MLHTFGDSRAGGTPQAGIVIGAHGVLFSTTTSGGSLEGGVAYLLAPPTASGVAWNEVVLYDFPTPVPGGPPANPGTLTVGQNGTLFGITANGGASRTGTAYALKPPATPGTAWTFIPLHIFTGTDGAQPTGLTIGTGGILYGTTSSGGAYGYGTVFALAE